MVGTVRRYWVPLILIISNKERITKIPKFFNPKKIVDSKSTKRTQDKCKFIDYLTGKLATIIYAFIWTYILNLLSLSVKYSLELGVLYPSISEFCLNIIMFSFMNGCWNVFFKSIVNIPKLRDFSESEILNFNKISSNSFNEEIRNLTHWYSDYVTRIERIDDKIKHFSPFFC